MDWTGILPFGMDRRPDSLETFAGFKCDNVYDHVCHSVDDDKMEPKHDNVSVDSFLGLGMENMGISSKMADFSVGLDFSFLPDDYGGLDSWSKQDNEAGLKPEILDGFLDEVEEVEHIYASHSSTTNHSLPETQVNKNVSELAGEHYSLMNFSSESYSPSGSIGLSEWSKESAAPHAGSSGHVKDGLSLKISNEMDCSYESKDDRKPLSTLLGSWVGRGRRSCRFHCCRLDSFGETKSSVSYDFRPRKEPLENYIHHITESIILLSDDSVTSSESEDDISVTIKSKSRSVRRKHQRMWTVDEVVKLLDGISHFGVGKWTDIKNFFFHSSSQHRTPIDIRDKWRNLLKANFSNRHNGDEKVEEKRRSAGRTIPKDILHRVRELASLHSKSLCFVHGSSRSPSASRKKKKKKKKRS